MPEAVIVAAARSPIGRAFKGSLTGLRGDDLAATIARAALSQVPAFDPHDLDDVLLGCAQPAGEQGYNLGRMVALQLGLDDVPGTVVQRYCASSVQTTRMAFHAIKAGEGHAFLSAGVEVVSRYDRGKSDGAPGTHNARYAAAEERTVRRAEAGAEVWRDPREDGAEPDVYIAMGQTAENVAQRPASPAGNRTSSPYEARTWPSRQPPPASGPPTSPRLRCPTAPWSTATTAPAPG